MARTVIPGAESPRLVFEFRHESWFTDEVYRLLSNYGAVLCVADLPKYPRHEVSTANFAYFRFHGRTRLFASDYTKSELGHEAKKMRRLLQKGQDVYAYFNNNVEGHAVANARALSAMIKGRWDE